jgi:site-specific recombinase XerD
VASTIAPDPEIVTPGDLGDELASFIRSMRAENVSANTILTYGTAVRRFAAWLLERGYPTTVSEIEPRHIQEWITSILDVSKAATAHNRYRGLQRFMNWYSGVVSDFRSPMGALHPPRLPTLMPRVLTLEELHAIVATCSGKSFEDRRDEALVRLLFDTGARRVEVTDLRYSPDDPSDRDIDMRHGIVAIVGKGAKDNKIGLGDRTLSSLDDYLRARKRHRYGALPWLWIGKRGRLTASGIAQMLSKRGAMAGIPDLHPHDFRHAATHHELAADMGETNIMSKRGWTSRAMLQRYASTTASDRSIEASRKLGLGNKI